MDNQEDNRAATNMTAMDDSKAFNCLEHAPVLSAMSKKEPLIAWSG